MLIGLVQYNPTIGDYAGNRQKMLTALASAKKAGASLIIFPELSTTGYPPRDLLEQHEFVQGNLRLLDEIETHCDDIAAIVGFVRPRSEVLGRRHANSAALLRRGKPRLVTDKSLLPTYDVFDENRYFEPAKAIHLMELNGIKLGVTICEDLWNNWADEQGRAAGIPGLLQYERDPAGELQAQGCDLLINISASPFWQKKPRQRAELFGQLARRVKLPLIFVNQVGANDDLIFDGASFVLNADGKMIVQAPQFEESLMFCTVETKPTLQVAAALPAALPSLRKSVAVPLDEDRQIVEALTLGIADYFRKSSFKNAVIGLSGGVDSALVAALAVRALGREHVKVLMMPSRFTSNMSRADAKTLADNLGIELHELSIEKLFGQFQQELQPLFGDKNRWDITEENLQSRIRGTLLMAYSNKFGHLVLSTGNKSELAVGYCTLYGDLNGGLAVISDVFKTTVYRLCELINSQRLGIGVNPSGPIIPVSILKRAPTAELRDNQTDQETLPPYELLDQILRLYIEEHLGYTEICERLGKSEAATVQRVLRLVDRNEFKRRQAPLGLKISTRAFGHGRRLPIAHYGGDHGPREKN